MVYLIFFLANRWVSRTIDGPPIAAPSVAIDVGLLATFACAHSVMAREGFKRRLASRLPAELERSTYALVSAVLLILLCRLWQPLPEPLWVVASAPWRKAIELLAAAGWLTTLAGFHSLGHLELFGLGQAWAYARGEAPPPQTLSRRGLHGQLRHPVYLGFLIAIWATPVMSRGHLLFSIALSLYVLIGTSLEETALERRFGEEYRRYRREVPAFLPRRGIRAIPRG